jgi:hypothetical protein
MASATHVGSPDRDIGGLERYVVECQELDVHVGVDLAFKIHDRHQVLCTLFFGGNAHRIDDSVCRWSAYDCIPTSNPVAGNHKLGAGIGCTLGGGLRIVLRIVLCAIVDVRQNLPDNAATDVNIVSHSKYRNRWIRWECGS